MALSGSRGTFDCPQTQGVLVSASGCSSCQKKPNPQKARRRRQGSHLQWFRLRGHHGQVLSLLAVKPLVRAWSKRKGSCLCAADAHWLLLGLEQKYHKISCFCSVCKWHLSNSAAACDAACQGLLGAAPPLPLFQLPTSSPPHCSLEKAFPLP